MAFGDVRMNRFARWESTTVKILGSVEVLFAIILMFPLLVAVYYGEDTSPFITIIPALLIVGSLQYLLFKESKYFRAVNGLLMVGLSWVLVFALGMYPYVVAGMSPVDALFESVSGLTTTGATIMEDIESWPKSILIWRSMSQWVGGIAVIIIFMYVLPMFGMGRSIFANELAGSGSSDYSLRMKNAAKSFIFVYGILTLINYVLLLLCGVGLMDATCLAFTTISTGGLMCRNDSLAGFSDIVQVITIIFMFLGGVNFYLHYAAIYRRNRKVYRSNSEFKSLSAWFIGVSVIISLMILIRIGDAIHAYGMADYLQIFKDSLFTVVSIGTSTGFAVIDYMVYPDQCIILLMVVAFIGASAGSTSGGVKFGRLRIIYEFVKNSISKTLHPNAVTSVNIDGHAVDNSTVLSAVSVFLMFFVTLVVGAVFITMFGYDILDAFGLSICSIANGGLAFGNYGPSATLADLNPFVKLIMIALMWIGRLEVMIALVYFTPAFWREMWLNYRAKKREKAFKE